MPFKSKDQVKACFAKDDPKWDCKKWSNETSSIKKLPKNLPDKTASWLNKTAEGLPKGGKVRSVNNMNRDAVQKTTPSGPQQIAEAGAKSRNSAKGGIRRGQTKTASWLEKTAGAQSWLKRYPRAAK